MLGGLHLPVADLTYSTGPIAHWTVTEPEQADVPGRDWPSPRVLLFLTSEVSITRQSSILRPIPVDLSVEMLPFGEPAELVIFEGTSGAQGN